jgi:hypothetical protein
MSRSRRYVGIAAALLGLVAATACGGNAARDPNGPSGRVVELPDDARASLHEHHGVIVAELHSRSGIGHASFAFRGAVRGARFVLHTRGLEQFRLSYAGIVIDLGVGSDGGLRQTLLEGHGGEQRIDAHDPHWMPVRLVRADRRSMTGTLEAVEVETPGDFATVRPDQCSVSWVDYFR